MQRRNQILRAGGAAALCALVAFTLCLPTAARAQTATLHEYELKAGVLFHILEYVEWPAGSLPSASSTVQIGLLGQIPFADALQVLDGKMVQGRKLVLKQLSDPAEALDCQVLFVAASEKPRFAEIVAAVKKHPILTVGEVDGFAENGGIVNLLAAQNRIQMEINREAAGESRLSISSQLLKLAKVFPR
ncbi:MAG TPA: YfiR family protein [Candidatus Acidoferrum sp.]|jgi:hypothetical protein|nr:YfiR family protein [Candidatus Acidoferrum sp.]